MMRLLFSASVLLLPLFSTAQARPAAALRSTVDSLVKVCRDMTSQNRFEEALQAVEAAEKAALSGFQKESAEYAKCLHEHGRTYASAGKAEEAEPFYLEALSIRGRVLGKKHVDYGRTLNNLASLYEGKADYLKAEPLFLESLQIKADAGRKDSLDYTFTLNNLGNLYSAMGRHEEAEALLTESLRIRQTLKGRGGAETLGAMVILGNALLRMGRYADAEALYLETMQLIKNTSIEKNAWYAGCLSNLSSLYTERGEYSKAEPFHEDALRVFRQYFPKNRFYAVELNNTALFYMRVGQFDRAASLFEEARVLTETTFGKTSLEYARVLDNLGSLHLMLNQFDQAEQDFQQAKETLDKMPDLRGTPEYARMIGDRSTLYMTLGRYEEAEQMISEGIQALERTPNRNLAIAMHNRAILYDQKKQYDPAFEWLQKSLALKKQVFGEEHPSYATSLSLLADLYAKTNNWPQAMVSARRADQIRKDLILHGLSHFSEAEMAAWIGLLSASEERIASYLSVREDTALAGLLYDNALFFKGFLLNSAVQLHRLAIQDSAAAKTYEALSSKQFLLSREYAKPVNERTSYLGQWEREANALEKTLARTTPGYAEAIRQVGWRDVQARLLPGEAAIEFLRYRKDFPQPTDTFLYAALLLLPDAAAPRFIPLCQEQQLEQLVFTKNGPAAKYLQNLYSAAPLGGAPLYQLLWQPLVAVLKKNKVRTVYYVPSGLLHRLHLAAITDPNTPRQTLADQYRLVLVGSTRQWTPAPATADKNRPTNALVYGGIRYNMDSTAIARANAALHVAPPASGQMSSIRSVEMRGDTAPYLPGTEKDARYVYQLLQTKGVRAVLRVGHEATEGSLKRMGLQEPSPSLLHIGTHGFFFPDPKLERKTISVKAEGFEPVFKTSDLPLIRSGLKLAGADYAWTHKRPLQGMEDGILTAYEVSQMNLSGTYLVVLSACETGLGDILGNEGVYGLQRAFRLAGAKNVLMSLWKVPDAETHQLMSQFYQNWLEKDMPIREALEKAQASVREKSPNPYYWAGFVLIEE